MPEYLPTRPDGKAPNESAAIAYGTLNLGPMERDADTAQNHLHARQPTARNDMNPKPHERDQTREGAGKKEVPYNY